MRKSTPSPTSSVSTAEMSPAPVEGTPNRPKQDSNEFKMILRSKRLRSEDEQSQQVAATRKRQIAKKSEESPPDMLEEESPVKLPEVTSNVVQANLWSKHTDAGSVAHQIQLKADRMGVRPPNVDEITNQIRSIDRMTEASRKLWKVYLGQSPSFEAAIRNFHAISSQHGLEDLADFATSQNAFPKTMSSRLDIDFLVDGDDKTKKQSSLRRSAPLGPVAVVSGKDYPVSC
mmetsp:Transcript_30996/g.62906  ORF Transcript_30996/g.62906 Transcript_30996/m.62906 type:complete len:231 (-) Transcript_30996:54-746(-)